MKLVEYRRVSTKRQGKSGLGLEAQDSAVASFAGSVGGKVLGTFQEVETGTKSDEARPELRKALDRCKLTGAVLVVAKLDRLSRNVSFLATLIDSGVEVRFCDMPFADRFTVHIMAAVAEKEAKDISQRTTVALAQAKKRGTLLGGANPACRNLTARAIAKGHKAGVSGNSSKADEYNRKILPVMQAARVQGKTFQAIADELNENGYCTRRGNPWGHVQVKMVLDRYETA